MAFTFDGYEEISADLDQASKWFEKIGLSTTGSRLNALQTLLRAFLVDMQSLPREEVVAKWSANKTYYALADARGFARIAREIGKMPHRLPLHKLRTILSGPLDPTDENPSDATVQARNFFAELELAADLSSKGLPIIGFDDVQIRFDGRDLYFECKRIHSASRVAANVNKAVEQLSTKMPDDRARGFITVVLDRLTGVDRMILRVYNDEEVTTAAQEQVSKFLERYAAEFQPPVDTRI